ncbi:MAG: hypothetical protein JNJ60_17605 [Rhodocyclaceae bacterium]|nr:hypothetical protein [Rhodocyclaceae bacterium]
MHGGKEYDSAFGQRMRGSGPFADLLAQRFRLAAARLGLDKRVADLDVTQFRPPRAAGPQMELF